MGVERQARLKQNFILAERNIRSSQAGRWAKEEAHTGLLITSCLVHRLYLVVRGSSAMKIEASTLLLNSLRNADGYCWRKKLISADSGGDGSCRATMLNNAAVTATGVPRQIPQKLLWRDSQGVPRLRASEPLSLLSKLLSFISNYIC